MQTDALTNVNTPMISDKKKMLDALLATSLLLVIIWTVYFFDHILGLNWRQFGLRPRTTSGLTGLFTMHFLHGDLRHIWQNTLALIVMNSFLFYFYRKIALKVFGWTFILPGILLWLGGRPDNHIGASMLIYGEAAFLFFSGMIRGNSQLLRVALLIILYYGGLVWFLFPIMPQISWEGHLSGALIGTLLAFVYKTKGPQRQKFQWEVDEELEAQVEEENVQTEEEKNKLSDNVGPHNWTSTST